jgi:amino acid transporter
MPGSVIRCLGCAGSCSGVLAVVIAVNLRGIAHSARAFIAPTAVYVGSIVVVILIGRFRSAPAAEVPTAQVTSLQTAGVLLLLKAFANGCAALTGVEAIANAVPSFRKPAVRRA